MIRGWPRRRWFALVSSLAMFTRTLAATTNNASFRAELPDDTLWPQGRYVYQRNCLVCHGAQGDGRGEMGNELTPPPRNFARGVFKYRSTPPGFLPTDADLAQSIRNGLTGTAMPIFTQLSDREVRTVIEYVKSFSPRWRSVTNYAPPLAIPRPPGWFEIPERRRRNAGRGEALFQTACAPCHGIDGAGRDATAKALEDSLGQPVTPTDLRQPGLRSGRGLEVIYRVLMTGIEGTPMPSFADAFNEDQRWELVAYIGQLRVGDHDNKPANPNPASNATSVTPP
jgi:mono/diheme cytochrome c family protein